MTTEAKLAATPLTDEKIASAAIVGLYELREELRVTRLAHAAAEREAGELRAQLADALASRQTPKPDAGSSAISTHDDEPNDYVRRLLVYADIADRYALHVEASGIRDCAKRLRQVDAGSSVEVDAGGWLPIESAPKDGSRVLVIDARDPSRVWVARYNGGDLYPHVGGILLKLTHWRHLPAPPQQPKQDGSAS